MRNGKRIGLALSGGGYRAAAFHLGTLQKLDEMGLLNDVDVLSTISGGSITGGAYCLYPGSYVAFHTYMVEQLRTKNVIKEVLLSWSFIRLALFVLIMLGLAVYTLTRGWPWSMLVFVVLALLLFLLLKFQFDLFPASKEVEKAYNKFLFEGKTLKDFEDLKKEKVLPRIAIGSSNLQTGRPFTFSGDKMSDSTYAHYDPPVSFLHGHFPIARAVMASSCVPFAFTPIPIDKKYFKDPNDFDRINPQLVDGGVYDNQGIQKITQEGSSYKCDVIITSDAGGPLSGEISFRNTIALLIRTVDVFMYRIKTMQMVEQVYQNVIQKHRPIAYFSLGWRIQRLIPGFIDNMKKQLILPEVLATHGLKQEWIDDPEKHRQLIQQHLESGIGYESVLAKDLTDDEWDLARHTGTNLTSLSEKRISCLIRHAANLTELQVRLYCPGI
jgi:NTE family protein